MKLLSKKPDKKTVLKVSVAGLTLGVVAILSHNLGQNRANNHQLVELPEPASLVKDQPDSSLPEGVISPTEIVKNPNENLGKELRLKGTIVEISKGEYILAGLETTKAGAIRLNISGFKGDINQFTTAKPGSGPLGAIIPVIVSGKTSEDLKDFTLIVSSIDK